MTPADRQAQRPATRTDRHSERRSRRGHGRRMIDSRNKHSSVHLKDSSEHVCTPLLSVSLSVSLCMSLSESYLRS